MAGRVAGRVAVVTGAANGIGRAIAERLAGEGASLVGGDLEATALEGVVSGITATGGRALGVVGDLTEPEAAKRLVETAVREFGRLDILVNNVGGSQSAPVWEMPEETWEFVLRLNLRAMFLCTRAALRQDRVPLVGRPRGHAVDRVLRGRRRVFGRQGRRARLRARRRARGREVRHYITGHTLPVTGGR